MIWYNAKDFDLKVENRSISIFSQKLLAAAKK